MCHGMFHTVVQGMVHAYGSWGVTWVSIRTCVCSLYLSFELRDQPSWHRHGDEEHEQQPCIGQVYMIRTRIVLGAQARFKHASNMFQACLAG
jgi:hypothetical protein